MRRFIPFMILTLLLAGGYVLRKELRGTGSREATSRLPQSPQICPIRVTAQPQTSTSNAIFIDKGFSPARLRHLQRALDLLRQVANEDRRCNRSFRHTGDLRLLREFLEDSRIRIHYDPVQEY